MIISLTLLTMLAPLGNEMWGVMFEYQICMMFAVLHEWYEIIAFRNFLECLNICVNFVITS